MTNFQQFQEGIEKQANTKSRILIVNPVASKIDITLYILFGVGAVASGVTSVLIWTLFLKMFIK